MTKRLWTDANLDNAFRDFNDKYFGGKLAVLYVRFQDLDGSLGHTKAYRPLNRRRAGDQYGIRIAKTLRDSRRLWLGTLIHEMVHVEQRNRYSCNVGGWKFNNRMKELANLGAFNGLW